ncbi:MAG: (d)CMP kinase [Candidatus Woesearchaeota archaeon]
MIITISGRAASGKSSVARIVAEKLGYRHYSAGDMQRELARERGLTITELGILEQKDDKLDKLIDDKIRKLCDASDLLVIDAWLAPMSAPKSFRIFLQADEDSRVRRKLGCKRDEENLNDFESAKLDMHLREQANRERWIRYYNFDFLDLKNYDCVIDTTNLTMEQVVQAVLDEVAKRS